MTDIVERLRNLAVHCTILGYDTLADGFQSAYAEIDRLRLSLSEARATGRREGMDEVNEIISKSLSEGSNIPPKAVPYVTGIRAAIRAAMEKAE